jgi:hypothetical protein
MDLPLLAPQAKESPSPVIDAGDSASSDDEGEPEPSPPRMPPTQRARAVSEVRPRAGVVPARTASDPAPAPALVSKDPTPSLATSTRANTEESDPVLEKDTGPVTCSCGDHFGASG